MQSSPLLASIRRESKKEKESVPGHYVRYASERLWISVWLLPFD